MLKLAKRITFISLILIALCIAPILIYIIVGPEDGNPVGLGLIMVFGTTVFGFTATLGVTIWAIATYIKKK